MLPVTQGFPLVISLLVWGFIAPQGLAQGVRPDALIPPRMPLPAARPRSGSPLPGVNPTAIPSAIPFPVPAVAPAELPGSIPSALPAEGTRPIPKTLDVQPVSYTLQVGDRIFVGVVNVPEYSAEYQIQVDGTIHLPVIGNVSIWGMTLQQAAQNITQRYTEPDVLRHPSISVSLLAASPLRVVISGQISRPGAYTIGLADGKFPTLTDAIRQAGGMTELADLRQVQVIRPQRSGTNQVLQVNLWELLHSGDARQDITLRNGDSIVLATARAVNPAEAVLLGSANLSPDAMQIGVLGEVGQPGTLKVPPNTPLNQVLMAAGGFSGRANKGSVELIRLNPNGTVTQRHIQVNLSSSIDENINPILTNRDVIVVGRSRLASIGDVLGKLLSPLGKVSSVFELFTGLFPHKQ